MTEDNSNNLNNLKHIAIIMDGNGRWATERGKDRVYGHRAGVLTLIDVAEYCVKYGIEYLTVYAFSTENWRRPENERKHLFSLLREFYKKEIKRLLKNDIRVTHIGDISKFPKEVVSTIQKTELQTDKYLLDKKAKLTISIALNYGARDELVRAVKNIVEDCKSAIINGSDIDENVISGYLDTKNIVEPDLLIRTSGEYRLSNFLLYQLAYTELYFTDCYWPDFDEEEFVKAIDSYKKRKRKFGGV